MAVIENTEGEDAPATVPAPPDLLRLATSNKSVFQDMEEEDAAGELYSPNPTQSVFSQAPKMMNLLRIAICNITYIRGLFPEDYFRDSSVPGSGMTVKKLITKDVEARRLIDWIEQGIYDALQKEYLETVLFCICEKDEGAVIDEYAFTFRYPNASCEDATMEFRLAGSKGDDAMFKSNPTESTNDQIRRLIRASANMMSSLDQIPDERTITIRLMYYDDVTPEDYEPPLFECCSDDKDDTNLVQSFGRLCCVSQRGPTLLLDSGATHHICCDKTYLKEMEPIPKKRQIELATADDDNFMAEETGVIETETIHMNQIRYIPGMKFNFISIGYLDKQGLLVSIVNSQVFIIDVSKSLHVGEGYRHRTNNDYVLKSMKWNVQNLVKLRKKKLVDDENESWVIDSGCASHMVGRFEMLTNPKPFRKELHTPRASMISSHKGSFRSATVNLSDVLYCPASKNNLLSVGVLDSQGCRFTFYNGLCSIVYKDTLEEIGRGLLDGRNLLYYLQRLETKSLIPFRKRKTSRRNKF